MKNYIYIALVALLITSGFFTTAHAQGDLTYTPLEPIAGLTQGNTNVSVPELLNAVFKILFSLGALLAVFMLVLGGISYMASSIPGVKKVGLDRARAALFGLLILAGSYLILNTINPELVKLTFIVPAGGSFTKPNDTNSNTINFEDPDPNQNNNIPGSICTSGGGAFKEYYSDDINSTCIKTVSYRLGDGVSLNLNARKVIIIFKSSSGVAGYESALNDFAEQCGTGGYTIPGGKTSNNEPVYLCLVKGSVGTQL